jgi:hypothetical protein
LQKANVISSAEERECGAEMPTSRGYASAVADHRCQFMVGVEVTMLILLLILHVIIHEVSFVRL